MRSDPSAYAIRLRQLLFGVFVLGLGLFATRGMMRGGTGNMKMVVAGIVGVTVLLAMDRHYWMLWPLLSWGSSLVSTPILQPLEMACVAVIGASFVRRALRRQESSTFRPMVLLAAPYFLWAALAFVMNPSGVNLFGSQTIGGRFYVKLLLGFWTMLILSAQRLTEDDCRRLVHVGAIVLGLTLLRGATASGLQGAAGELTSYELLAAVGPLLLLLSRYRLRQFLALNWRPLAAVLLAALTLQSGKRRALFNIGLFPLVRAFVARQDRALATMLTLLALAFAGLLALGQGRLYDLPLPAQRALSILPGRWDSRLEGFAGGRDPFREHIRRYAWNEVRRNPWFGRKGFALDLNTISWASTSSTMRNHEGHGVAGNWHNTWIGMMADFGIPGALFWGLFSAALIVQGLLKVRACPNGSYQQTVAAYYTCMYVFALLSSHTSGHSALQPFYYWPTFGLILAVTPPAEANRLAHADVGIGDESLPAVSVGSPS